MKAEDILTPVTYPLPVPLLYKGTYVDNGVMSNYSRGNKIHFCEVTYDTVEAAYVAAKNPFAPIGKGKAKKPFYLVVREHEQTQGMKGLKRLGEPISQGGLVEARDDWEDVKVALMFEFIRQKTVKNTKMTLWLLEQDPSHLIAFNNWGDAYWGAVLQRNQEVAIGLNVLGGLYSVLRHYIIRNVTAPQAKYDSEYAEIQTILLKEIDFNRLHVNDAEVTDV